MNKSTKLWLLIAALLILMGSLICCGMMTMLDWDFTKLSTNPYEPNHYEVVQSFRNICVETDAADLTFALSGDGKCRVECYEETKTKHSVSVEENTLVVKRTGRKDWYDYIGTHFGPPKITVYLPNTRYTALTIHESTGDVVLPEHFTFERIDISLSTGNTDCYASASEQIRIKASTGVINVYNVSAGVLDLSATTGGITVSNVTCTGNTNFDVTTGKVTLTDMTCSSLSSAGNTGDISLHNVIVADNLSITRTTGDVRFEYSDAGEILVVTDTGDVTGNLLSSKVFLTKTNTGDTELPPTASGDKCEIYTDTGDIRITIA